MGNLGRTTGWINRVALVNISRVQNLGGVTYEKVNERGRLQINVPKNGEEEKRGGGERESRIIEVDNIVVCAGRDPNNDLEITARGGRREGEAEGEESSMVGESE